MPEEETKQLNIRVTSKLHNKLKFLAQDNEKTMGDYINKLLNQYADNDFAGDEFKGSVIKDINIRLSNLENILLGNNSGIVKETPFTAAEAKNCTYFMKGLFEKVIKQRDYKSSKAAWLDFIPLVEKYNQWNKFYTLRLKEILLIEEPDPWTDDELNELCYGNKCPCPIYSGLKEWTGAKQFPTQQNICDRGDQLIESIEIV